MVHLSPIDRLRLECGAEQLGRSLLSGGEKERCRAGDFDDLGCGSVWIFRCRKRGQHILARTAESERGIKSFFFEGDVADAAFYKDESLEQGLVAMLESIDQQRARALV